MQKVPSAAIALLVTAGVLACSSYAPVSQDASAEPATPDGSAYADGGAHPADAPSWGGDAAGDAGAGDSQRDASLDASLRPAAQACFDCLGSTCAAEVQACAADVACAAVLSCGLDAGCLGMAEPTSCLLSCVQSIGLTPAQAATVSSLLSAIKSECRACQPKCTIGAAP